MDDNARKTGPHIQWESKKSNANQNSSVGLAKGFPIMSNDLAAAEEAYDRALRALEEAKRHIWVDVYKAEFRPLKGTLSGRRERMLMKLCL